MRQGLGIKMPMNAGVFSVRVRAVFAAADYCSPMASNDDRRESNLRQSPRWDPSRLRTALTGDAQGLLIGSPVSRATCSSGTRCRHG